MSIHTLVLSGFGHECNRQPAFHDWIRGQTGLIRVCHRPLALAQRMNPLAALAKNHARQGVMLCSVSSALSTVLVGWCLSANRQSCVMPVITDVQLEAGELLVWELTFVFSLRHAFVDLRSPRRSKGQSSEQKNSNERHSAIHVNTVHSHTQSGCKWSLMGFAVSTSLSSNRRNTLKICNDTRFALTAISVRTRHMMVVSNLNKYY